jgi:BirA family biotin operon repressor/biotin-[acetyl-CoA-carboxylase] ligase
MNRHELAEILAHTPVTKFRYFDSIGSTNTEALTWSDSGAPDYSIVLAEEQTEGRGRLARRWVTNPGSALAFSLILRPTPTELGHLALISPLCALALRESLETLYGLKAQIKWPNDLLLAGQKTSGILVESTWTDGKPGAVIAGIGINVFRGSIPPATAQLFPATCIEEHYHGTVDRMELLKETLNVIAKWRSELGSFRFFQVWEDNLAFKGELVRIEDSQKSSIIGIEKGINSQGNLVLILGDGQEKEFAAGDVHLRPVEQR